MHPVLTSKWNFHLILSCLLWKSRKLRCQSSEINEELEVYLSFWWNNFAKWLEFIATSKYFIPISPIFYMNWSIFIINYVSDSRSLHVSTVVIEAWKFPSKDLFRTSWCHRPVGMCAHLPAWLIRWVRPHFVRWHSCVYWFGFNYQNVKWGWGEMRFEWRLVTW